jgi:hypothetical protein
METRKNSRGRGGEKQRGRNSSRGRGAHRRSVQKKKNKTRLTRPTSFENLFALFNDVPNMTDQESNSIKLLQWYVEYFFDIAHLQQFHDFATANPQIAITTSRLYEIILNKLKEASSDPIQLLREPYSKRSHFSRDVHQKLCVSVICSLDNEKLHEAYSIIPNSMKTKVLKAFWKKRKEDCTAWEIDQNELPTELRKRKLQSFKEYVKGVVDKKEVSNLERVLSMMPEKVAEIEWPFGYSALRYAARFGGVKVASVLLTIQKEPEKPHREKSFNSFLEEYCPRFIPIYNECLTTVYEARSNAPETKVQCGCVII